MKPDKIKSELDRISNRLNTQRGDNNIKRQVSKIRKSLEDSGDNSSKDYVTKRRERTLTNQDEADLDYPLPQEIDGDAVNIDVPRKHIEKLTQELTEAKNELRTLSEKVNEIDLNELSNSMTRTKEEIFGLLDDLEYSLFNTEGVPVFREHAELVNYKSDVSKEDIETLKESLDRIIEECSYVSRNLKQVEVPDKETVKEEAQSARAERAKREYEQMKPYMSMQRIQESFEIGEVFTPEELADQVEPWSNSTAKSTIESAMELSGVSGYPEIEEVAGDTYKLVESDD